MVIAWCLAPGVVCKPCPALDEILAYSNYTGTAHVVANVGFLVVDMCRQGPQTMDSLLATINEIYEAELPEELTSAATAAVRQLQSLGILTQCAPP